MARGRMIDKRVGRSKKLGKISDKGRTLWFMIYPHLDREGRICFDDLEDLKIEVMPYFKDWSLKKIAASLNEIADIKLIDLYFNGNKIALQYKRFEDFQTGLRKEREAPSKIIAPEEAPANSRVLRITPALSIKEGSISIKEGRKEEKTPLLLSWNSFAEKYNLAKIKGILKGSAREKALVARVNEGMNFEALLKIIEEQPFLLGQNKNNWMINFDWIIKSSNYQKILELQYKDRTPISMTTEWLKERQKKNNDRT